MDIKRSHREYLQECIDMGMTPEPGTYVLDAPLVIRGDHQTLNWPRVILCTEYPASDPEG